MALPGPSTQKANMSTQQPEALRLADIPDGGSRQFNAEASAELRRLHAEVERLRKLVPDIELAHEAIYAKAEGREA